MKLFSDRAVFIKLSILSLLVGGGAVGLLLTQQQRHSRPMTTILPEKPILVKIDLDRSIGLTLPKVESPLIPVSFRTPDGRTGWSMRISSDRPIATPAYADGLIFLGGGYGSHEFYAFNADTGKLAWQIKTSDDGPTAAVVEDGCVAFNTESCTVVVADAKTGRLLWQEWLGDPLMSQPAISKGRLYMAYPSGQRGSTSIIQAVPLSNHLPPSLKNLNGANSSHNDAPRHLDTGFKMLCADLRTGNHIWTQSISADVLSAPIIERDRIYMTCFDGTSFCLNADTGAIIWQKQNSGTSAPVVANGQVVISQKSQVNGKDYEGMARFGAGKGEAKDNTSLTSAAAPYFKNGHGVALNSQMQKSLDSSVGFGAGAPAAAAPEKMANVGVTSVAGGWAYQGSKTAYSRGRLMNAQGSTLNSLTEKEGRVVWKAEASGRNMSYDAQIFSPPALGIENMYLCTTQGNILAVNQQSGQVAFQYSTGLPMAFQPALANGNIYIGTANGMLICLKTGQHDADGWYAWGGNAQHNKKD